MLHLKGYFPAKLVRIDFQMLYQAVGGGWRVFGLSVNPGPPTVAPASAEAGAPASTAVKKK